jgi:hypothetical protein
LEIKTIKNIIFLSTVLIILSSCEKKQYCASCYESDSGYQAVDFCSDSESVDVYIDELYSNNLGQDWYCTKSAE